MNNSFYSIDGFKLNSIIADENKESFRKMLPQLLERVNREVIYEYAFNDELRMAWAKHIFNESIVPFLDEYGLRTEKDTSKLGG